MSDPLINNPPANEGTNALDPEVVQFKKQLHAEMNQELIRELGLPPDEFGGNAAPSPASPAATNATNATNAADAAALAQYKKSLELELRQIASPDAVVDSPAATNAPAAAAAQPPGSASSPPVSAAETPFSPNAPAASGPFKVDDIFSLTNPPATPNPFESNGAPGSSAAPSPTSAAAPPAGDGGASAWQATGAQVTTGLEQSSALVNSVFEQMLELIGAQNEQFGAMSRKISDLDSQIKSLKNP